MAKISKKTIENLREFLDRGCEYAGTQETVQEIADETLKEVGCKTCLSDEALIIGEGTETVCTVDQFADCFWDKAVEKILNVLSTEE